LKKFKAVKLKKEEILNLLSKQENNYKLNHLKIKEKEDAVDLSDMKYY
jgi:hypothetical protein